MTVISPHTIVNLDHHKTLPKFLSSRVTNNPNIISWKSACEQVCDSVQPLVYSLSMVFSDSGRARIEMKKNPNDGDSTDIIRGFQQFNEGFISASAGALIDGDCRYAQLQLLVGEDRVIDERDPQLNFLKNLVFRVEHEGKSTPFVTLDDCSNLDIGQIAFLGNNLFPFSLEEVKASADPSVDMVIALKKQDS